MGEKETSERVVSNPRILAGKPAVKGTRLSVEFILSLFSKGWTESQVLKNYTQLTKEDLNAVFAYAATILKEEKVLPLPKKAHCK
jgi:uncharacterized protein (DUF433 family)